MLSGKSCFPDRDDSQEKRAEATEKLGSLQKKNEKFKVKIYIDTLNM